MNAFHDGNEENKQNIAYIIVYAVQEGTHMWVIVYDEEKK